jgi:bile acid:Na+ symporter, BASS family
MRARDFIMIVVAFAGIAGGVFLPAWAGWFTPVTIYMMVTVLYLSFLRIDFGALARLKGADLGELAWWSLLKLVVLPVGLWALAAWLAPSWALPVLLLSGVSAGVTAPFFSQLLGGDQARTLQLTVLTSVLVPFTLPALVGLLAGHQINLPLAAMGRMLAMVIFVPLVLAWLTLRLLPALLEPLARIQFPLVVTLFFLINLGVFAPFSSFFFEQAGQVVAAVGLSCLLAAAYFGTAWASGSLSGHRLDRLSCGTGLVFINNVLVVVVAAKFFGPRSPLLAAAYMLPFFLMLLPFRHMARRPGGRA